MNTAVLLTLLLLAASLVFWAAATLGLSPEDRERLRKHRGRHEQGGDNDR